MATVPGTLAPDTVSLRVKVSSVPAGAELIVAGVIARQKVAVTAEPLTTLLLLLLLVATVVALLRGLAVSTVGLAAVPPGAPNEPGTTVTPAGAVTIPSVLAFVPPPPHAASDALSSNAVNQDGVNSFSNLFILMPLHLNRTVIATDACRSADMRLSSWRRWRSVRRRTQRKIIGEHGIRQEKPQGLDTLVNSCVNSATGCPHPTRKVRCHRSTSTKRGWSGRR